MHCRRNPHPLMPRPKTAILAFAPPGTAFLLVLLLCPTWLRSQTVQRWESEGMPKPYPTIEDACNAAVQEAQKTAKGPITLVSIERTHDSVGSGAICHLEYRYVAPGFAQPVLQPLPVRFVDVCSTAAKPSGFCSPERAANLVLIRITGTVAYGSDASGVFGKPATDLTGKPFTLLYRFNDAKGVNQIVSCSGPACASRIASITAKSSPGTAELRIGDGPPHAFGISADGSAASSVQKNTYPCCFYGRSYLLILDVHDRDGNVTLAISDTAPGIPATTDGDWRAPFADARVFRLVPDRDIESQHGFSVHAHGQLASGALIPETLCVGSACGQSNSATSARPPQ